MAETTHIEWTDATWNPVTGCSVVSPGCTNCYAMRLAGTRLRDHPSRAGLTQATKAGPVWTGEVRFNAGWLDQPLRWRKPRRIFVCAHGDLFHESVPDAWIDQVFAVMALAPHHTFQVLTKRAARMRAYLTDPETPKRIIHEAFRLDCELGAWMSADLEIAGVNPLPLPNVWLGVSAEDQPRADERIPELLATPAAVRWVSLEPMVGPVDLTALDVRGEAEMNALEPCAWTEVIEQWRATSDTWEEDFLDWFSLARMPTADDGNIHPTLDWVVLGGESGPGARPLHPDWARQVRDACAAAGVPFFVKQWGAWAAVYDRDRDDPDWIRAAAFTRYNGPDGRWMNLAGGHGFNGDRVHYMRRLGKSAAGRLLDGVTHDAMPGAPAP